MLLMGRVYGAGGTFYVDDASRVGAGSLDLEIWTRDLDEHNLGFVYGVTSRSEFTLAFIFDDRNVDYALGLKVDAFRLGALENSIVIACTNCHELSSGEDGVLEGYLASSVEWLGFLETHVNFGASHNFKSSKTSELFGVSQGLQVSANTTLYAEFTGDFFDISTVGFGLRRMVTNAVELDALATRWRNDDSWEISVGLTISAF